MKYAIFSDIHANLEALTAAVEVCRKAGVDEYISLGDIVGYNANPKECLDLARSLNMIAAVKGNHDEYVSNNDEVMDGFNPHAREAVLWTKAQLNAEDRKWLANLPMRLTIRGTNITIVHATLDSPDAWGYIFDAHHAADNFAYQFTPLCFCGHSHVPITFCKKPVTMRSDKPIDELPEWSYKMEEGMLPRDASIQDFIDMDIKPGYKYLINVGSIGQPRNRDPRASFAIFDTEAKKVMRYRVPYDIRATQKKIIDAGLPERLAVRLERGN